MKLKSRKEKDMELKADEVARKGFEVFGTAPPTQDELDDATRILAAAPITKDPLVVARYFENLPDVNKEKQAYNAEWPERANPVIVAFFLQATNYGSPNGDDTPWCAAFMNWCLMRAGKPRTKSASSGSFRCFALPATSPHQVGDIAVFKKRGYDEPCSGKGHVAFWLAESGDWVTVLGGNQGDRVKVSKYPAREAVAGDVPWLMAVRRN
ncbi:MAG: hypothetical protein K0S57_102 [Ramlibacter sp.]|jgi:uncharacterized protein (TIGR02594 family)|nr:hypothetical protein [Ramlibacter sp.]